MDIDKFLDIETETKKEEIERGAVSEEAKKEKIGGEPIEETKEGDAIKRYSELWKKVSESKLKWDYSIYSELNKAENRAKESLDKSMLNIEREKNTIKKLIRKTLGELRNKNYEAATRSYSELTDMRDKFPGFFLEEKKRLNKEIFEVYQKLHDQIDSKFIRDFKDSLEKINNLIRDAFSNMAIDIDKAKNLYEKALDLYKDLPNGFMSQKLELGKQLLTLYKDLSIQTQIKTLQKQLSKGEGYKYVSGDERLKRLSEVIKRRHIERPPTLQGPVRPSKTLFPRLIERKLERAKINLQKGLYLEAKKNVEAILKADSENVDAKELLNKIPAEY
jgi:hypothetical protein|tara:strand:+ start:467 stop:1465 length:999 start_codon:yes stop_codon:yes gene_type:complete